MGRKYIKQRTSTNFVYPNNSLEEYDIEIVHDINNNSVSGTTTSITASSVSSSGITFSFDYTWSQNSAEPFVFTGTSYSFLSVHMMEPNTIYYKPWRLVSAVTGVAASTKSGTVSFTVTPSQMGVSLFTNGVYSFEIRMIGKRAIFPICQSVTISTVPAPSPTPTRTPQATPTPTPTSPPSGSLYTSGATINVTDTGYLKYTSTTGDTYFYCSTIGTQVLTDCLICSSIRDGIPFQDLASWTVINCGTTCGGPTPSPTPTPSTPPISCPSKREYYISNGGTFYWIDCNGINRRDIFPTGTFICICNSTDLPVSYDGGTGYLTGGGCACP